MSKRCKECEQVLPFGKFNKSKNVKDGFENKCKICRCEARKKYVVTCESCEKSFRTAREDTRFCSHKCMGKVRIKRKKRNCDYCDSEILVKNYLTKIVDRHYCNQDCRTEHLKEIMVGENNPNYTSEKKKCDGCSNIIRVNPSRADKYNFCSFDCYKENIGQYYSGKNNPNYNDELTYEERVVGRNYTEYEHWRKRVFKRDGFTCQCCGDDTGGNLVAHHILNYTANPKLRVVDSNGITFCDSCHRVFHNIYGYTKNTHEQLREYLNKQAPY